MVKLRPFLKWAGNKYRCIEPIINALPQANCLIEPFAGSGAVFLNADYPKYILGEQNQDLVALYTFLKKEGSSFIQCCKQMFTIENNAAEKYYQYRKQFNECKDLRERAILFLYLNRHGYNGLCRYNLKGDYNVPFGRYTKPYFPEKEMNHFFDKSQNAKFVYADYQNTFQMAQPGDIIYCDPPYAPLDQKSNFTAYTGKKFRIEDQVRLSELAVKAANQGITVLISNHDTEFTRHHYKDSEIRTLSVKRSISCQGKKRNHASELLAIFR